LQHSRRARELWWDRPESERPRTPDGNLAMVTGPLNLEDLLKLNAAERVSV
jgi:catechol 2,3-dioxygenase